MRATVFPFLGILTKSTVITAVKTKAYRYIGLTEVLAI